MNFVRYASWLKERGHDVLVFCVKNSPIDENAKENNLDVVNIKKNKKRTMSRDKTKGSKVEVNGRST